MAAPPEKLAALRHLLAERFPTAQRVAARTLATGLPTIDEADGGLPLGALTEIVCSRPSCGAHLLIEQLLQRSRENRLRVALVDASDCFDPDSVAPDLLAPVLWVRCHGLGSALQAADILARDANLGLLVLDLRRIAEAELRRTPSTFWYRLQRALESTDLAFVVQTPRACVPSAHLRLALDQSLPPLALVTERPLISGWLQPQRLRQRLVAAG